MDRSSPLTLFFEAAAGPKERLHKKRRNMLDIRNMLDTESIISKKKRYVITIS